MRLATLAIVFVLGLAAPAWAQTDSAPVVGGGSFNAAPILEPGRYHDTILPAEYLYYGFKLEPGQRLRVTLEPDIDNAAIRRLQVLYISGNIHSPTRALRSFGTQEGDHPNLGLGEGDNAPLVVTSPEASAEEDTETAGPWEAGGVYYFTLHVVYSGEEPVPRAEIPFTFDAEVQGAAQPAATPTATPTPTATAAATAAPERAEDDDGPKPALAAGFGVGGILIGVVAGIALRQRRR